MDLVLVNPGSRRQVYQSLGTRLSAVEPPVWAGLMATHARRRGWSVAIVDANAQELTPDQTAVRVAELDPLLTAVVVYGHQPSASTQNMPVAGAVCRALKQLRPQAPVILVGGHVSTLAERTLREEAADYVCEGEGPLTLDALLRALPAPAADLATVPGLWIREQGRVQPAPALVEDLDAEMPAVAWDLLPMDRYRAHNWHCFEHPDRRQPYASLYTTLGCPFHCSFCCIQAPFRPGERALGCRPGVNTYRFWSPDAVVAQIDTLVREYGIRNIKFADEMFVLNRRHVMGICERLIERDYDLNIWAYARVDSTREDMLPTLRRAGVRWLCFGIESGSARVRDDAHKGFRDEDVRRVIDSVRRAGIYVIGNYLFGLPEDDPASMQATLDLALDLNCEFANFYCAMAYPGSELYDLARRSKWPLPASWSGYSQHAVDTLPLPTRHLAGAEVLAFRDRAFQLYFNDGKYLDMIRDTFGPAVVRHIRDMAGHKLERQHRPAGADSAAVPEGDTP